MDNLEVTMYFPIFRGRQNELLAIRELISADLLSKKIIPIIDPVTYSPTYKNFLSYIKENPNYKVGIVINPEYGDLYGDLEDNNETVNYDLLLRETPNILPSFILRGRPLDILNKASSYKSEILFVYNNAENNRIADFAQLAEKKSIDSTYLLRFSKFSSRFKGKKVLLSDLFFDNIKKNLNVKYEEDVDEILNEDIDSYSLDNFLGFSDYSIIGDEFNDSGFLPKAVVIHFTYYQKDKGIVVRHFKSDSNNDNKDPAKKFGEALKKLIEWNNGLGENKINTYAVKKFEELFERQQYPGLGFLKKLCIMNHLEVVGAILDNESRG